MIRSLIIFIFNTTSRYLGNISNINSIYFYNMVCQIYPAELQLHEVNTSDTESKKEGKDQECIQSSTTHDPGYHMRK